MLINTKIQILINDFERYTCLQIGVASATSWTFMISVESRKIEAIVFSVVLKSHSSLVDYLAQIMYGKN